MFKLILILLPLIHNLTGLASEYPARWCIEQYSVDSVLGKRPQHGEEISAEKFDKLVLYSRNRIGWREGELEFIDKSTLKFYKPANSEESYLRSIENLLEEKDPFQRRLIAMELAKKTLGKVGWENAPLELVRYRNGIFIRFVRSTSLLPETRSAGRRTAIAIITTGLTGNPLPLFGHVATDWIGSFFAKKANLQETAWFFDLNQIEISAELAEKAFKDPAYAIIPHFPWETHFTPPARLFEIFPRFVGNDVQSYLKVWGADGQLKNYPGMSNIFEFFESKILSGLWPGKAHPKNLRFQEDGSLEMIITGAESAKIFAYSNDPQIYATDVAQMASTLTKEEITEVTGGTKIDDLILSLQQEASPVVKDQKFTMLLSLGQRITLHQLEADLRHEPFWGRFMHNTEFAKKFNELKKRILKRSR